jgi:two-component system, cell cycle response regulator DivK
MARDEVRVLIVDDDADMREVLQGVLELDGYRVDTAPDAATALRRVAELKPLCVILDLQMPGVGGIELTQQLRAAHGANLVLIVLTGSASADEHRDAEIAGVDYVMQKPLDVPLLRRILPRIE